MSESENSPKQYGFRLDILTPDFIGKIAHIYQETMGETSSSNTFIQQIKAGGLKEITEGLSGKGHFEYRMGSSLPGSDSKLEIKTAYPSNLFYFNFKPNFDINEKDQDLIKCADEMNKKFKSKVNEYLISSGYGSEF